MKKYSIQLLSGIIIILAVVSVFNWFINPYDIFQSPYIKGFNQYKSEAGRHTRLTKVYQVEREKPEVILLASSRGMVIPVSYFSDEKMKGYNFSLASASTYELFRVFQHAQAISPLKKVILAIDEDFTEYTKPNFSENRLAVDVKGRKNNKKWLQTLKDISASLLSVSALRSSIGTIKEQKNDPELIDIKRYNSDRVSRAGGHRQMFRTMEASIFHDHKGLNDGCHDLQVDDGKELMSVEYFERMVDLAYKNNIDLYIYLSPSHARLYEVNCIIGRWAHIEKMKRAVVKIVNDRALQYGRQPYQVWDFSGYNSITTETVPERSDTTSIMSWYWEGSHYTKQTARLIFNKIFNISNTPEDFGTRLTAGNIEEHLISIRDKHRLYLKSNAEDINELYSLFKEVPRANDVK